MWNYGVLHRLRNKHEYNYEYNADTEFSPIDLKDCNVLFIAWICGATASLIILFAELIYWKCKKSVTGRPNL